MFSWFEPSLKTKHQSILDMDPGPIARSTMIEITGRAGHHEKDHRLQLVTCRERYHYSSTALYQVQSKARNST